MSKRGGCGPRPLTEAAQTQPLPKGQSTGSAIGRQFAWVALGRVLAASAQAVLMVILIRSLAPGEFAVVGTVYGVLTFAQGAGGLGLPNLVVRERSYGANQALVSTALWLTDRVAVALAITLAAIGLILGSLVDTTFLPLIPLAVWCAAEFNADTWAGVALADGRGHLVTGNLVGRRLLNLGLFLALQLMSTPVLLAFGLSSALSAIVSVITTHFMIAGRVQAVRTVAIRRVLSSSRSYWVTSMAAMARNLDAGLVQAVTAPTQASFYAAAARLSGPMRLLPQSLASVLLPMATKPTNSLRTVLKVAGLALAVMLIIYSAAVALLPALVPVMLGSSYRGAIGVLQVTCGGLVLAAAASMLSAILQGVGHQTYVARVALVTTAIFLIGVVVGGHVADAIGAAAGAGFSYLFQSFLLCVKVRRLGSVGRLTEYSGVS